MVSKSNICGLETSEVNAIIIFYLIALYRNNRDYDDK